MGGNVGFEVGVGEEGWWVDDDDDSCRVVGGGGNNCGFYIEISNVWYGVVVMAE